MIYSQKIKGKVLKDHILKEVVPCGFNARIKEIQQGHQQAIPNHDHQIQVIQYEKVTLHLQRDVCQA